MKKSFIAGLAGTLVLGLATSAFAFTDVTTSHWAKKYVDKLAELKVVNGVNDTTFNPNGKVTRAEFAKMIVEAKGLAKENPATPTFSDVAADAWYFGYVEAAAKAGYVNGTGDGKFSPNANITRQEIAKIIVEAAGLDADDTPTLNFDDAADVSDWAKGYVAAAADAKFVEGYNNKFSPKNNATRAEAAKLTYSEMVYEGKIVEEEEIPVGYMKVTETPADNDAIELDGTEYTIKNENFKIHGEFVDDAQVFIDGTLVKVAMNDDDEILSIEADPKVVEGEVNGKGTIAGDRALTVDDKDVTWVDEDDYAPALTNSDSDIFGYSEIESGDKVVVLLNNEGLGYAALAMDSVTVKGELTAVGTTSDKEYYFVLDGKKYYSDEDEVDADSPDIDFVIYKNNGTKATTYAALETLMDDDAVAEIETNASGLVTKVTAYAKEITAAPSFSVWDEVYVNDSKHYQNNLRLGAITIGEKGGTGGTTLEQEVFRALNGSATVTVNGTTVDYEDLQDELDGDDYSATATVNGAGEVIKLAITDDVIYGQVSSFVEDSNDKVTKITINGKEYTLDSKYDNNDSSLKKGYFVVATVNNSGKIEFTTDPTAPQTEDGSSTKFQQYVVVATTFVKGYDPVKDAEGKDNTDSLVTGDNNVRLQNVDTGAYRNVKVTTFVKEDSDVKLNTVKAGDTVIIIDAGAVVENAVIDYAVINPITSTK